MTPRSLLCVSGMVLSAASWSTVNSPSLPDAPASSPPKIDGILDSGEWNGAATFQGTFFDDENGQADTQPITFHLTYDEKFIYFGVKVIDDPKTLIRDEYRPNSSLGSNDSIQLILDPFGQASEFNSFAVNPSGAYQMTLAGGTANKEEWRGGMRSAGRVLSDGWSAEMAIPWSIMSLPSPGRRDMRINVSWNDRSALRDKVWHFINGDASKSPLWKNVLIPKADSGRVLKLLPYLYAGASRNPNETIANAGLDFKTPLTPNSMLVGTFNPDFRNIENQVLSLDFSYFERLAQESRPFFLEGSGYRGVGFESRIFASQRIGEFDAGLNTYGRLDEKSTYSLLATQDFGRTSNVVATVDRQVGKTSNLNFAYAGGLARGRNNHAMMLNGWGRSGNYEFFGGGRLTDDDLVKSGSSLNLGATHNAKGWFNYLEYQQVSANFLPRLGFQRERNFRSVSAWNETTRTHPRGAISETGIEFGGGWAERLDGTPYRKNLDVNTSVTFRNGIDWDMSYGQGTFEDSVDQDFRINVEFPRGNPYRRASIDYVVGNIARQPYEQFGLSFAYRPIQRLQTSLSTQWQDHYDRSRQVIASFNWDLGMYESVGGRLVERGGKFNWYLSWRKSGGLGSEFFVILGDPNAREFRTSLIIKAVFPLSLKY